jgi:hypothetical protein
MSKVTLREARFDEPDLKGIWEIQRRLLARPQSWSLADFVRMCRHRWLNNPARASEHVFGWVLDSPAEGIVGFVGLVPVRMKIGTTDIVGACGSGFSVLPAHRAYSLGLYKQIMDWGSRHFLVMTTANQIASRLNQRMGMSKIPIMNFDRYLSWPIRPEVHIQWKLDNSAWRNWSSLVGARAPFAWLLKAAARARYAGHRRIRFPGALLPVEPVKAFTEEFTQFWGEHKRAYGITTVRDRAFLQWRHLEMPPSSGTPHVFACRDNGRVRGYLAMMELNPQEGVCPPGRFRVTDVFYDRSRPDVVHSLLNHAFESAKARGCSMFEVLSVSRELADSLQAQRPYVTQAESWSYWYKTSREDVAELCRTEPWWPSGVDGDNYL